MTSRASDSESRIKTQRVALLSFLKAQQDCTQIRNMVSQSLQVSTDKFLVTRVTLESNRASSAQILINGNYLSVCTPIIAFSNHFPNTNSSVKPN